ncbi:MAG: hypothetical protein JSW39_18860 [Desulfobacterales bacterium]|nr:MAG: hypothetical protein JSW39_18860 [Desulfobacterales bacterium]
MSEADKDNLRKNKGGTRSATDRRQESRAGYVAEIRSGTDHRRGSDRRIGLGRRRGFSPKSGIERRDVFRNEYES